MHIPRTDDLVLCPESVEIILRIADTALIL